ncbi:MAG: MucR family transcriptional regulator [Candidatus Puniceispirillum sp.]|nr:MucR family transcriptional regulator [Candidatus Pelagibacter sp.]MBA4283207.1 MucR family transcriptional regulator [Candidatus Puniceispirillum sp.]
MTKFLNEQVFQCTTEIVAACIGNDKITFDELPHFFNKVYDILYSLTKDKMNTSNTNYKHSLNTIPAVPIDESVFDDYIICLEDGKKLQMLKRHLKSMYGMSLDQYKDKWGLPIDYPVVAPNYAKKRSGIAKSIGLGKKSSRLKVVVGQSNDIGQDQVGVVVKR